MQDINFRNNHNELKKDEQSPLIKFFSKYEKDEKIDKRIEMSPKANIINEEKIIEKRGNFLCKLFFYDILKFAREAKLAFSNNSRPEPLEQKQITEYVEEFNKRFKVVMEKNDNKINNFQLIGLIIKVFRKDFMLCIFLYIIDNTAKVIYSLLVANLIESLSTKMLSEGNEYDYNSSFKYAFWIFCVMLTHLFSGQHNWFLLCKASNHLKLTLLSIIYNKLYCLSYTSLHNANQGKLFNIISGDMNILENKVSYLLAISMAPYTIILSSILLYLRFGLISFIAILCLFLIFLLQFLLAKYNVSAIKSKTLASDRRINITNELLEGIRPIKMYAWEEVFVSKIRKSREEELLGIDKMNIIISLNKIVAKITPFMLSSLIFLIHYIVHGNMVQTSLIFSTFQLFDFISIYTVLYFGLGALTVLEYKAIFERIATILSLEEDTIDFSSKFNHFSLTSAATNELKTIISMKNYTGYWSSDPQAQPNLKDINLEIKKGEKICVVGKIGSGKSTLLYSFLNEIPKYNGSITLCGSIAFIEQIPFIFSGTIRENILFGMIYNEEKYQNVLNCCALNEDLINLSGGDLTEIGEKGVTLSGGQKIRICLARALYSNADIYLLDDPFSSVDSKVARNIFENIFKQGILNKKTVVLVTHHLEFMSQMDKIILMDDGKIILNGETPDVIRELQKLEIENFTSPESLDESTDFLSEKTNENEKNFSNVCPFKLNMPRRRTSIYINEENESIKVNYDAYKNYFFCNSGNYKWIILAFCLFVTSEILRFFLMRIFGLTNLNEKIVFPLFYGLLLIYLIISLVKYEVFMIPLLKSNTILHNKIIESISQAYVSFFDCNPVGRILNRFTNDLGIIDSLLLITMRDNLEFLMSYFIFIFTVLYTCFYLIIPAFLLIVLYFYLYKYFKQIIAETKKMDLLSRGPIFSFFASTISGLLTIKIYQQIDNFKEKYCKLIEENSKKNFQFWAITRIYSFLLEFLGILFSFLGILLLILFSKYINDLGLISQSMISLIFMTEIIQYMFTLLINTEMMMNSTVRLFNYSKIENENRDFSNTNSSPQAEKVGEIVFKSTFLKYGENNVNVLKNINFTIKPGEKVGCVGRTGAGKTSLIQALFGMITCEPASQIKVNGQLIQNIDLKSLRSGMSIIPQNPFIFSGTIKQNLDPFEEYSLELINLALNDVNLYDYVYSLPNQINTVITNNSCVFSMGQKQMICLARALLKKNPILILDEATSSCDLKSDEFIQRKIKEKFKNCTVFTIAHRLLTIADYDKVLVMNHGEIVQFEEPYKLLTSLFNEEENKNEFCEMVRHTGSETAQAIFNKAKQKFMQKN